MSSSFFGYYSLNYRGLKEKSHPWTARLRLLLETYCLLILQNLLPLLDEGL